MSNLVMLILEVGEGIQHFGVNEILDTKSWVLIYGVQSLAEAFY